MRNLVRTVTGNIDKNIYFSLITIFTPLSESLFDDSSYNVYQVQLTMKINVCWSRTNFPLNVKSGYRIQKYDLKLFNFCDFEIPEFGVAHIWTLGSWDLRNFKTFKSWNLKISEFWYF